MYVNNTFKFQRAQFVFLQLLLSVAKALLTFNQSDDIHTFHVYSFLSTGLMRRDTVKARYLWFRLIDLLTTAEYWLVETSMLRTIFINFSVLFWKVYFALTDRMKISLVLMFMTHEHQNKRNFHNWIIEKERRNGKHHVLAMTVPKHSAF